MHEGIARWVNWLMNGLIDWHSRKIRWQSSSNLEEERLERPRIRCRTRQGKESAEIGNVKNSAILSILWIYSCVCVTNERFRIVYFSPLGVYSDFSWWFILSLILLIAVLIDWLVQKVVDTMSKPAPSTDASTSRRHFPNRADAQFWDIGTFKVSLIPFSGTSQFPGGR